MTRRLRWGTRKASSNADGCANAASDGSTDVLAAMEWYSKALLQGHSGAFPVFLLCIPSICGMLLKNALPTNRLRPRKQETAGLGFFAPSCAAGANSGLRQIQLCWAGAKPRLGWAGRRLSSGWASCWSRTWGPQRTNNRRFIGMKKPANKAMWKPLTEWDCCITKVGKASFRITPRRWRCLKRRQSRGIFRRRLTAGECFSRAKASEATERRLWTGIARPLSAWA